MKKFLGILLMTLFAHTVYATVVQTKIMKIEKIQDRYLVYAGNGSIYEVVDKEEIEKAMQALKIKTEAKLFTDETGETSDIIGARNQVLKVELTTSEWDTPTRNLYTKSDVDPDADYDPTDLMTTYVTDVKDFNQINQLFSTMRSRLRSRSQCYNRAHVWAWELHRNYIDGKRIQVGKMWLFFTRKYIREYNYKWWFHVAPYVDNNGEPVVIDRTFTNGPLTKQVWTDIFMNNRAVCKDVQRYSDYEDNQNSEYCYTIKTSQYYWQPWHIENLEDKGEVRTEWESYPLKKAYRNAIGWRARVPDLD